jgi:hypothetical protein
MKLSAFVAMVLGMVVEILLLVEQSLPPEKQATWQGFRALSLVERRTPFAVETSVLSEKLAIWRGLCAPGLSPFQAANTLLAAVTIVIIALLELLGWGGQEVSMSDGWVGMIFVAYGVFIFFAGIMGNILPRVNETSILSVQILVTLGLWANATALNPWLVILLVVLPALVMAFLVMKRTALNHIAKALVYFWYLLCLIVLIYENGSLDYFSKPDLTILEGFTYGTVFTFLILHALFSIRFFLITSSLIVPRNRPYVNYLMPHLFSDEQIAPHSFLLLFGIVLLVLLLNTWLQLVSQTMLLNVSVVVCVQFLFQSQKRSNV